MPLNDAKIRNLKTRAKAYKVADFDGLFLLVKTTGSKFWRSNIGLMAKKLMVFGFPATIRFVAQGRRSLRRSFG